MTAATVAADVPLPLLSFHKNRSVSLAISKKSSIFAGAMTKRRERNKPQQAQLNKQLEPAVVKPKEKNDTLVEVEKYY